MSSVEQRLAELRVRLPAPPAPSASCIPARQTGDLVYISAQDCRREVVLILGSDLTVGQRQEPARQSAINCLAVLQAHLGGLYRVQKLVELFGFVNSAPGFVEQPYVLNGASDLLEEVFRERGRHSRTAISANELTFDTQVEVKLIVEAGRTVKRERNVHV